MNEDRPYLRIRRAKAKWPGGKRVAMDTRIVAVLGDNEIDISECVAEANVVLKPGQVEYVEMKVLSFQVVDPHETRGPLADVTGAGGSGATEVVEVTA